MKRILKTLVLITLIFTVVFSMSSFSFASSNEMTNEQQNSTILRSAGCTHCGIGFLITRTYYTSWFNTGSTQVCPTHPFCLEVQQSRTKTTTFRCNYCNFGWDDIVTEYQYIHQR